MAEVTIPTFEGPALVGSEKQVAWATTIRSEKMWKARNYVNEKAEEINGRAQWSEAKKAAFLALMQRAVDALGARTAAAWWIDHRDSYSDPVDTLVDDEQRALIAAMTADEKAAIKAL